MPLTSEDIDAVTGLVNDLCGIALDQSKAYLIESRLSQIMARENCRTYVELARKARSAAQRSLQDTIIDAITTNETLFYRDRSPFEALQHKIIPELIDARSNTSFPRRLRIWSAACSTGQEPYSIAMTIRELIPDVDRWDVSILATDISDAAIRTASQGIYSRYETERGLTPSQLARYFVGQPEGWRVRDEVRSMVRFQRLNLLQPFVGIGPFDIIFCRNVAIYFTAPVRQDLFQRIGNILQPDGVLFVGSSESPGGAFSPQHHCRAVLYRKSAGMAAPRPPATPAPTIAPRPAVAPLIPPSQRLGSSPSVTAPPTNTYRKPMVTTAVNAPGSQFYSSPSTPAKPPSSGFGFSR